MFSPFRLVPIQNTLVAHIAHFCYQFSRTAALNPKHNVHKHL